MHVTDNVTKDGCKIAKEDVQEVSNFRNGNFDNFSVTFKKVIL